jgi:hypothetical protein
MQKPPSASVGDEAVPMMTALNLCTWLHARRRRASACLLGLICFSCTPTEDTPPPGVSHDASRDAAGAPDALGETAHDDASMDVPSDASIDPPIDTIADAPADRSVDVRDDRADVSVDAYDATDAADRSIDDVEAEAADRASPDAMMPDQFTTDAPDSDGKPRAATCTVDQPCVNGDCIGSSCDRTWECFGHFAPHPCPFETIPYCGCDGKTYFFPITCPEVPYEHAGACGDGVNCDPNDIRCNQPEPDCGPGRVASVVGTCYGPCVPIAQCRCLYAFECPKRDLYTCKPELHCDFEM